ncbi:MAG: twin-arginine translocase TatA/TatE family subunit [Bacteriovorax sp.]
MGINLGEGLLIAGIAIFFFGGKKIPELGKTLGASVRNFKEGLHEDDEQKSKKEENKKDS